MAPAPWTVLKFGGTSVSTPAVWAQIARRASELLPAHRVCIVVSALSGVSDRLERAVGEALQDRRPRSASWIADRHEQLADEVGLAAADRDGARELRDRLVRLLRGIAMTGEASPPVRARVLAFGELLSSTLGIAILARHGLDARWVDARSLLESRPRPGEPEHARFLDAEVPPPAPDELDRELGGAPLVLTQGFIARTPAGETCLLGRGGSDTSAALLAAGLRADVLEIWSDVHGLFTSDPREVAAARLVRRIGPREAQELAATGARVLHPRCLTPAAAASVPVLLRNTFDPDAEGTRIERAREATDEAPAVMAVLRRGGVTLVSLRTLEMYGSPGFLARTFAPFAEAGISVDLVATSQSAVTVTLDRIPGGPEGEAFATLVDRLRALGEVRVVHPCAVVSIVGRHIRTVLHQLGPAMAVFEEREVHLVSESSEDLNLSFVVDEDDAPALVEHLHARLIPAQGQERLFGPTWEMLRARRGAPATPVVRAPAAWWRSRAPELVRMVADGRARFVYDLGTVSARARRLRRDLPSVGAFFYAVKANAHQAVLETLAGQGFGMECVSAAEAAHVRGCLGARVPLLFTPNFCPPAEYAQAFEAGAEVTIDGEHVLEVAPELFRGRDVIVRVDPGRGLGHHESVRTAGAQAKFGQSPEALARLIEVAERLHCRLVGLHAHVGSGILDAGAWRRVGATLVELCRHLPHVRSINVGGGLGVSERPGQPRLDLASVEAGLREIAQVAPGEMRLEPGRWLVSEAGVLLAPVTQVRHKAGVRFVGVATGMNSLIRPALYGAWHGIHNLSRLDDPPAGYAHVVGPICESADVLGRDRLLPDTSPGDVLLVENCGAYGAVMSSRYNLREPAEEVALGAGAPWGQFPSEVRRDPCP